MVSITAYSGFSKRKNSTKQPTGGTAITATLKDDVSMSQPVFILAGDHFTYNYVEFAGRYYFVDDVVSLRNNLCEVHCSIDVLATYKSAIQASSAYVLYYDHSNTEIVDHRLSTKTTISIDSDTETFNNLGTGQSYLLTAIGEERTSIFACDKSDIDDLFTSQLLQDIQDDFEDALDAASQAYNAITAGDVQTALIKIAAEFFTQQQNISNYENSILFCDDAQKFVKNCFVLPIDKSNIGGTNHHVYLGKWQSDCEGNMGFPRIVHDSATLSIPWQASDWRRNEPYHEIYLYIPYIGLIQIPASEVIGVSTITVNVSIDTYSGVTSFVVNAANGTVIGQYSTNIAAPYCVGSSNINVTAAGAQIIASAAAIAGGALTGNAVALSAGALGIVNSIKPFDESISGNGGCAGMGLGNTVKCFTVFHDTTVSPSSVSAVKGTPYNGVMSLSGVSGYVQTAGASVDVAGYGNEKDQINNYLDGGIYIE